MQKVCLSCIYKTSQILYRFFTAIRTELKEFVDCTKNMYNAIIQGHNQDSSYQYIIDNVTQDWLQPEEYKYSLNWVYSESE